MKKNVLSILDVKDDIEDIIDLGIKLKQDAENGQTFQYLKGKILAMIFERASTRTRASFEVGTTLLGGHAVFLNKDDIKIGERESVEDIALVLSRYIDIIIYRPLNKEKRYGKRFLRSLPPSPVCRSLDEVRAFFKDSEKSLKVF